MTRLPEQTPEHAVSGVAGAPAEAIRAIDDVGLAAIHISAEGVVRERLTGTAERSAYRLTVTVPAQHAKRPAPWAARDPG